MSTINCRHANVAPEVCDQTLGVICKDCGSLLAYCWMEEHVSESLWNRAAESNEDAVKCELNRDDFCAICETRMT